MAFLHSLSLNLVFLSAETGAKIKETRLISHENLAAMISEEAVSILINQGILVPAEYDDVAELVALREKLRKDSTLELLYLLITDSCDMQCTYCFEEHPIQIAPSQEMQMSTEIAQKAIDFFARMTQQYGDSRKEKVIQFYGGEPLLNRRVIKFAVDYVKTLKQNSVLPRSCKMATVTNGLLMDEEMAHFFADYEVSVGLSLDGPAFLNNAHRLPKDRRVNAFERTARALSLLQSCGASIGLSVTLTPLAIDHFAELLDFLLNHIGKVDGISLNLLNFNRNIIPPPDYYERAAQCQLRAFERFRKRGIFEERIMRKARAFAQQRPMFGDCGVQGNQLVVSADGKVGVCQDFMKPRTYFRGNVLDDNIDPVADGLFDGWGNRSPFFMERCFDCPAISICGGGCPANAELKTGNRWNVDERVCPHSLFTLEWLVWETYVNATLD